MYFSNGQCSTPACNSIFSSMSLSLGCIPRLANVLPSLTNTGLRLTNILVISYLGEKKSNENKDAYHPYVGIEMQTHVCTLKL